MGIDKQKIKNLSFTKKNSSIFEQPKITKMARYNPAGYNSAYTYRKSTLSQDNPWTTGGERDMDFRQRPFQNEKPISNNYNYPASSMHVRPNLRLDEHLPRNMHGVCPVQRPRPVQYMSKNLLVRRQEEYEDELVELNFLRRTEPAELNYLRNKKSNITRCDNPERDNFLREEYQDPRPVAYRLGSAESNNAPLCKFFTRTGKCRRFHSECPFRHEKPNLNYSDEDIEPNDPQYICYKYRETGDCSFGEECKFIHVEGDIQNKLKDICYQYRDTGDCPYGDECKFLHEEIVQNEPKAICYQYRDTGDCPYGDECKFLHEEVIQNEPKDICYQYRDTGDCPYGDECKFSHEEVNQTEPKSICYQYRDTGDCPYGEDCKFTHEDVDQPESKAICYQYRDTGDCPYGDTCKFSHEEVDPDESSALCYKYRDTGECPYGDDCKFKHVKKVDETAKKICSFYTKTGSCIRYNSECPFRHVELENIEIKRKSNQDESTKDDEACVGNAKRPRISFP